MAPGLKEYLQKSTPLNTGATIVPLLCTVQRGATMPTGACRLRRCARGMPRRRLAPHRPGKVARKTRASLTSSSRGGRIPTSVVRALTSSFPGGRVVAAAPAACRAGRQRCEDRLPRTPSWLSNCFRRHACSEREPPSQPIGEIPYAKQRLAMIFTCDVCGHRQRKEFFKMSYEKGVVLVTCDSCKNNHLVADNLGWFDNKAVNLDTLMQEKGEEVRKLSENGTADIPLELLRHIPRDDE